MRAAKSTTILVFMTVLMMLLPGCLTTQPSSVDNSSINGYLSTDVTSIAYENSNELSDNSTIETIAEGKELTSFIDSYTEVRKKTFIALEATINSSGGWPGSTSMLASSQLDIQYNIINLFDSIDLLGGLFPPGTVDTSYKNMKGNIIDFGFDYTHSDSSDNSYPVGSHILCEGHYDMINGRVTFDITEDKKDQGLTRTVMQINKISTGTYASQIIHLFDDGSGATYFDGRFSLFKGNDLYRAIITGPGNDKGIAFTYNSIYDKTVSSLDDMTNGFDITMSVEYIDGQATFETGSDD